MSAGGRRYRPVMDGEDLIELALVLLVVLSVMRVMGVIGG